MLCNVQKLRPADWPSLCFLTAIHQRRHALLHPDPDEWQWEQRRERTNPHPRFPQDRSDAALHEPHRQHGTGCFRHVIVMWPCRMTRYRCRVGQKESTKTRQKKKQKIQLKKKKSNKDLIPWLSGLTHLFPWLWMCTSRIRRMFTAKVHSTN